MTVTMNVTTGAGTSNNWSFPERSTTLNQAYATRQVARRSANTAYWAIPAFTEIADGATINSAIIRIDLKANTTGSDETFTVALTNGTTVVGTASGTYTRSTADHTDDWTVTGLTAAQLRAGNLQVRTVDNRDSSTGVTISIDRIAVLADYTAPEPAPKLNTLVDEFVDNAGGWSNIDGTTRAITGGALEIIPTTSYPSTVHPAKFDATDSEIIWEVRDYPTANGSTGILFELLLDASNKIGFGWNNGSGTFRENTVAGAKTTTYDSLPAGTRFYRLRHTAAGGFTFAVSSDGSTWTEQAAHALASPGFSVTNLQAGVVTGYWDAANTQSSTPLRVERVGPVVAATVHSLAPVNASHASAADAGTLAQQHALAPVDAAHAHSADAASLTQTHILAPVDAAHQHLADGTTQGQVQFLEPTDALHSHTATTGGVASQVHALAPTEATHATTADSTALVQVHALTPTDASHAATADTGAAEVVAGGAKFTEEFGSLDLVTSTNTAGRWRPNDVWQPIDKGYEDFAGNSWNLNPNESLAGAPRSAFSITADHVLQIRAIRTPEAWKPDIVASSGLATAPAWSGGILVSNSAQTAYRFNRGYFEFKIRFPNAGKGMFPAAWLFGANGQNPGKERAEIDLFEVFGYALGRPYSTTLHEKKDPDGSAATGATTADGVVHVGIWDLDTAEWHTYALDWQSSYLRFYRDDSLLAELTGADADFFANVVMAIRLNYSMDAPWFPAERMSDGTTPDPLLMEVDYVRVWDTKPGQVSVELAPADALHGSTADAVALGRDALHGSTADATALVQDHALAPVGTNHAHEAGVSDLDTLSWLAPTNAQHSSQAGSTALTQAHALAPEDALHDAATGATSLTQAHALAPGEAGHSHAADSAALDQLHVLTPDEVLHSSAADIGALAGQDHALVPEGALHASAADAAALGQLHVLEPTKASHSHIAETASSDQLAYLAPASARHAHGADEGGLSQVHALAPVDAAHGAASDPAGLAQQHALVPVDASHAHAAEATTFDQAQLLIPTDASHSHTAGIVAAGQTHLLAPRDAAHPALSDAAALGQLHVLEPAEASHAATAEATLVLLTALLLPSDAQHAQTASAASLTQGHRLSPERASAAHSASATGLVQDHAFAPTDAAHSHTVGGTDGFEGSLVLPPARALVVAGESRVLAVAAEARTAAPPFDQRVLAAPVESRVLDGLAEDRVLLARP